MTLALCFAADLPPISWTKESNDERAAARAEERGLVLRVRASDAEAFALLVRRHLDAVTRMATYLVGSADAAEDVAQRVLVQLWEHRVTLDPERPLTPYLRRSVRNCALNDRKAHTVRAQYRERIQGEIAAGTIPASTPSPEETVLTVATVQAALHQLPHRRQLALRLWFEEELTYSEIADILETSVQATDRLLRRALADLREMLLVSKK
jgi:RNA polymerase sigma factor (sigma-70 family)